MRRTLAFFENKFVAFGGWETGSRHDRSWVCLSKPYVALWDKDASVQKSLKRGDGYKFDHLWLTSDQKKLPSQQIKTFKKVAGIGIVRKYKRIDGSFDYTVKIPDNRLMIEDFLDGYNETFDSTTQAEKVEMIQDALGCIALHKDESKSEIVFGIARSVSSFYSELLELHKEMKRSVEVTEKTLKTVKAGGKCKSLDLIDFRPGVLRPTSGF
tara:strand:+ start:105 stop:740 length:636 start_codon:yes stop_codon:yes gene_type:complete